MGGNFGSRADASSPQAVSTKGFDPGRGRDAMIRCDDCRFWSQMVAFAEGGGPVKALCLADGGPLSGKYVSGRQVGCGFKPDLFGKVDDPPNYGEHTSQAYIDEEGPDALSAASVVA